MTGYLALGARYPKAVVALLLLITLAAASRLGQLELYLSAQQLMMQDDPGRRYFDACRETFGGGEGLSLFLHDERLLAPDRLHAIRAALQALEALPGVAGSLSLFSLKRVRVDEREQVHSAPYLAHPPATAEATEAWLRETLRNPLVRDNLLSVDGRSMLISLRLAGTGGPARDRVLVEAVEAVLAPLRERLGVAFQIGPSVLRQAVSDKIVADQRLILPAAMALLLLILALILRRLHGALIPLTTAGLSLVWTLGLLAQLGIPLNVLTAIVPALLVVVGSTEDIHLLAEYHAGRAEGLAPAAALERMTRHMGVAVALTFLTTAFGFLSIAANPIPVLREFGLVAAAGLGFNFLITGLLVPAWLRLAGPLAGCGPPARPVHPFRATGLWLLRLGLRRRRIVTVVLALLMIGLVAGATRIRVDNDPLDYFAAGEEVVQRFRILQEQLTGGHLFSIVLDAEIEGTFSRVRYLEEIARLQRHLDTTGWVRKSLSFADIMALVNAIMDGPPGAAPYLPDIDELVQEYLLFLDRDDIAEFVSADFSQARILVRHDIGSSHRLAGRLAQLQAELDTGLPRGVQAHITGEAVLTGRAADHMALGQALSLGLVLLAIWVLISLVFVDPRAGLIAIVPQLLPIALLFGVMGWGGLMLDTGTAMVAAIALGICVDDTTHFMVRYHQRSRGQPDPVRALEETVREEATPLFSTSLALAAGFALLGLSGFPPVARFGLLSAMVVLAALLATFVITPLLLRTGRLLSLWDLLDLHLRHRVQKGCRLFQGLRVWQIKRLILLAELRVLAAGDTLYRAGEPGAELYLVLDGELELWGRPDGLFRALGRRGPGETLGESALLEAHPRRRSAIALTDARVLVLRWDGIRRIVHRYPRVGVRLFRNLSLILGAAASGVERDRGGHGTGNQL